MKKILTIYLLFLLASCASKKNTITEIEKIIYKTDTIVDKMIVTITEPVEHEVQIPCDSTYFEQKFKAGNSQFKVTRDKGQIKIVYVKDKTEKTDRDHVKKSNQLIKESVKKDTTIVRLSWWEKIMMHFWMIAFILIFILWIFGITPKTIIGIK